METLLTPYEVRSAGQTFARLADIGHALIIMHIMLNESPSKVHLFADEHKVFTAGIEDLNTPEDLEKAHGTILETLRNLEWL